MAETFVLVAGAWHGGWAWNAVASRLRALGHRVLAPTMPGLGDDDPRGVGLQDAVAVLTRHIERHDLHDVTLVAHSWGGFVACGAAPTLAKRIRRIVFWSAFVPHDGESFLDACPPQTRHRYGELAARSADNTVALPFSLFARVFMQDASEEAQRVVHQLLRPQPYGTFTEPARKGFFGLGLPTSYILSTEDRALPPGEHGWSRFADRLASPLRIEIPGSHESCFTRPDDLAHGILSVCPP
jgi:pimeloyl-ACP methyl ester carboxylesterase